MRNGIRASQFKDVAIKRFTQASLTALGFLKNHRCLEFLVYKYKCMSVNTTPVSSGEMNSVLIPVQQQLPGRLRDLNTSQNKHFVAFVFM